MRVRRMPRTQPALTTLGALHGETTMPVTLNYGTNEEAERGRQGFAPPEKSGDYKIEITGVNVTDNKNYPGCTNMQIRGKVVADANGEVCVGAVSYFFMVIPAGQEETYSKLLPDMQKARARDFITALGIDLTERDAQGKTTMQVEPESWKGRSFWGYVKVGPNTYTDKDGNEKTVMRGDVEQCLTYAQVQERAGKGTSLRDAAPASGEGEIPANA